jgi:hypothetical protein
MKKRNPQGNVQKLIYNCNVVENRHGMNVLQHSPTVDCETTINWILDPCETICACSQINVPNYYYVRQR